MDGLAPKFQERLRAEEKHVTASVTEELVPKVRYRVVASTESPAPAAPFARRPLGGKYVW